MPNRVCGGGPAGNVSQILHEVTHSREDVTLANPPPRHEESPVEHIEDVVVHVTADSIADACAETAPTVATGVSSVLVPITLTFSAGVELVEHADAEADRENRVYNYDRLRGALAALEGRADSVTSQREAARSRGYADGIRDVELFSLKHPNQLAPLAATVRRHSNAGQLAVVQGQDHGPCFEQQYHDDPAFTQGVDYMREMRRDDPVRYEAHAADLRSMGDQVRASRAGTAIRS